MILPEFFPRLLKTFSENVLTRDRSFFCSKDGRLVPSSNNDIRENRDPIYYVGKAILFFAEGDVHHAVKEAVNARLFAPGSSVLTILPLYFQHSDLFHNPSLYSLLINSTLQTEDPLDRIISELSQAESKGRLKIEFLKPDSENKELLTEHLETPLQSEDDYRFITPTYISIFEEQGKWAEALFLIEKYSEQFPELSHKFSEIKTRLEKKLNS